MLLPDFWGYGFAREAISALIPYAFDRFSEIPAIDAEVDPRNEPSLALLYHFGFEETARVECNYQMGDEMCDTVYLALPRPK